MPIFFIIAPKIPVAEKQEYIDKWPSFNEDVKAQPGVAWLSGGPVIAEDGKEVDESTEARLVQCIAFKTPEDFETFKTSAWAAERQIKWDELHGPEAVSGAFDISEFPEEASPKAFIQFSSIVLNDSSKVEEAKAAWLDLVKVLGNTSWAGGKSIGDGPSVGLGMIGWNSFDEVKAAYQKPDAAAALATYRALGETHSSLVEVRHS